ncbi:MAG TPA: peptidylprolyl isomerase [Pseudomonadales bacterium]|nr:peptidylprolyl isomerase [Pseudomonadales bacterium]
MKLLSSIVLALFAISALAESPIQPTQAGLQKQKVELGASLSLAKVEIKTSEGDITIELDEKSSPVTVANFLKYVDDGFYTGTLFHRVIADFMIQGGGMTAGMAEKPTSVTIKNESANGLKNLRGSIAMARKQDPDSASSQFYINLADNPNLDGTQQTPGYTVFGRVTAGMDVVDRIASAPTGRVGMFQDVPVKDVVILGTSRIK